MMSLKLKAKILLFRILNLLPKKLGFRGYHYFQKKANKVTLDQQLERTTSSYRDFLRLTQKLNIPIEGKRILEIGSGWLPLLPYFFKFLGRAETVYTYDLNQHFDQDRVETLNKLFSKKYEFQITEEVTGDYALPKDITYFPNTDITSAELPPVEVVFSRFVLEHVEPEAMREMHEKFKHELPQGSYVIHFISPSDHRAYVDKTLSLQDFLRYSQGEWDKKQTKFDYHNRWRLPQYLKLFRSLSYEIIHLEYDIPGNDSDSYKKFKKVPLHKDFQKYTDKELMAGAINIVLKVT